MGYLSDVAIRMSQESYDLLLSVLDELKSGNVQSPLALKTKESITRGHSLDNVDSVNAFIKNVNILLNQKVHSNEEYIDFKFDGIKWDENLPDIAFFTAAMKYTDDYDFLRIGETAGDIEEDFRTGTYPFYADNDGSIFWDDSIQQELTNTNDVIKLNDKLLTIRERMEQLYKEAIYLRVQDEIVNNKDIVSEDLRTRCNDAWAQYKGACFIVPDELQLSNGREKSISAEAKKEAISNLCFSKNLPEGTSITDLKKQFRKPKDKKIKKGFNR